MLSFYIKHRDELTGSSASFMDCVEECICERKSRRFEEELNTKSYIYKRFGKSVEYKKYLHRVLSTQWILKSIRVQLTLRKIAVTI